MVAMVEATIREMEPTDLEPTRQVLRAANLQFADRVPAPLFDAYLRDVLDIESRLGRSRTIVADIDGRVVGTITYFRDANDEGVGPAVPAGTAGIRAVAVDPDARGLGIGGRLAATAVDLARCDGAPSIVLHTWAAMSAAIAVYERLGFRRAPAFDSVSSAFFASASPEDPAALAFWLDLAG